MFIFFDSSLAFSFLVSFFAVVSGSVYATVDIFNVSSGTWATAALSVARWQLAAASLPGVGLAFFAGGSSEGLTLHKFYDMSNFDNVKQFTQTLISFYTLKMRSFVSLAQARHTPRMQQLIFSTASLANGVPQLSVSPESILLERRCQLKIWSCLQAVQVRFLELQALPPLTHASQMQLAQHHTPPLIYTTRPLAFGAPILLAVHGFCSLRRRCHCKA